MILQDGLQYRTPIVATKMIKEVSSIAKRKSLSQQQFYALCTVHRAQHGSDRAKKVTSVSKGFANHVEMLASDRSSIIFLVAGN